MGFGSRVTCSTDSASRVPLILMFEPSHLCVMVAPLPCPLSLLGPAFVVFDSFLAQRYKKMFQIHFLPHTWYQVLGALVTLSGKYCSRQSLGTRSCYLVIASIPFYCTQLENAFFFFFLRKHTRFSIGLS